MKKAIAMVSVFALALTLTGVAQGATLITGNDDSVFSSSRWRLNVNEISSNRTSTYVETSVITAGNGGNTVIADDAENVEFTVGDVTVMDDVASEFNSLNLNVTNDASDTSGDDATFADNDDTVAVLEDSAENINAIEDNADSYDEIDEVRTIGNGGNTFLFAGDIEEDGGLRVTLGDARYDRIRTNLRGNTTISVTSK